MGVHGEIRTQGAWEVHREQGKYIGSAGEVHREHRGVRPLPFDQYTELNDLREGGRKESLDFSKLLESKLSRIREKTIEN